MAKKDQDIMALKDYFTTKEEEVSKLIEDLNERCQLLEEEKGKVIGCGLSHWALLCPNEFH